MPKGPHSTGSCLVLTVLVLMNKKVPMFGYNKYIDCICIDNKMCVKLSRKCPSKCDYMRVYNKKQFVNLTRKRVKEKMPI